MKFGQGMHKLFLSTVLLLGGVVAEANAATKSELLQHLSQVLQAQDEKIRGVDQQLADLIEEAMSVKTSDDPMYENLHSRLAETKARRQDLVMRMGFLERLRGQFVELFTDQDLRNFLQARLSAMARNSYGVSMGLAETGDELGEWLVDLKISLGQAPAEGQRLLEFFTGAVENLPVRARKNPIGVVEAAQYTNGAKWESAQPAEKETEAVTPSSPKSVSRRPVLRQTMKFQQLIPPAVSQPVEPQTSPADDYE